MSKPNAVLFKLNDGRPVVVKRVNGAFDWEVLMILKEDLWPDLSIKQPFEFVFVHLENGTLRTETVKCCIPDSSFLLMVDEDILQGFIEDDYNRLYNK